MLLESAGWAFVTKNLQLVLFSSKIESIFPLNFCFLNCFFPGKSDLLLLFLIFCIVRMWLESNSRYLCKCCRNLLRWFSSLHCRKWDVDRWLEPHLFSFYLIILIRNNTQQSSLIIIDRCSELNSILKLDYVPCKCTVFAVLLSQRFFYLLP